MLTSLSWQFASQVFQHVLQQKKVNPGVDETNGNKNNVISAPITLENNVESKGRRKKRKRQLEQENGTFLCCFT